MNKDKLKLISEAVACNSCSIWEFAASVYSLVSPVRLRGEQPPTILNVGA